MERRRYVFRGSVQGVGFRATAQAIARQHDVTGWVRNEADGSVLIEVQGEPPVIELYLIDLRERMSGFIKDETNDASSVVGDETVFEIRH